LPNYLLFDVAEAFLAFLLHSKRLAKKNPLFEARYITSRREGPANNTGSNIGALYKVTTKNHKGENNDK
jgi:hypothetical protein